MKSPMNLQERIREDLKEAVRREDRVRRSVLRLILAGIRNAEIAQQKELDDAGVIDVLTREVKQRRESIEAFRKGNRQDLVTREEAELAIILGYLPEPMTREEIVTLVRKIIAETGAKGPGDKGKVMGQLMPQVKGRAEGKEVSTIVSELLASR